MCLNEFINIISITYIIMDISKVSKGSILEEYSTHPNKRKIYINEYTRENPSH